MRNHLSYRWPAGPCRTPAAAPAPRPRGRKHRVLRAAVLVLAGAAALALLLFLIFCAALQLSELLYRPGGAVPVQPSASITQSQQESWSPEQLPWGDPNPRVEVALSQPSQQILTPQEIYRQVLPSVVCVQAAHERGYSVGSGVILTATGYLVTNYHVIQDSVDLAVMLLADQQVYPAQLIGYDEEFDLAVLKIDASGLTPARLADSDKLQVGDAVYAIGNPMGYLYGTMTDGIVSSLAREVEVDNRDMTLIQTSVPLNTGNSGGALVDAYGQVVGITSAKISGMNDDVVVEGIGLAIPITDSLPFLNHIIQTGRTCRPGLGVTCNIYTRAGRQQVIIHEVTPGAPADGVLEVGDELLAVNGQQLETFYQFTRALYDTGVGNPVELTVLRDGAQVTVTIVLYDLLTADGGQP